MRERIKPKQPHGVFDDPRDQTRKYYWDGELKWSATRILVVTSPGRFAPWGSNPPPPDAHK